MILKQLKDNENGTSISDLRNKMTEVYGTSYSTRWIKAKLKEEYGESIVIISKPGMEDLIFFSDLANEILYNAYNKPKDDKTEVLRSAANLIKHDINKLQNNDDHYFPIENLNEDDMVEYIPESLRFFLESIAPKGVNINNIKLAGIGQSVIQYARPKSIICPLQIAMGVEIHHKTGSELLITLLNKFGFCSQIHEVRKFEKSACFHTTQDLVDESSTLPLFSADNADFLRQTIDGHNTLHIMGIIKSSLSQKPSSNKPLRRLSPSNEDIMAKNTEIKIFNKVSLRESTAILKQLDTNYVINGLITMQTLDILRISKYITDNSTLQWAGFMKVSTKNNIFVGPHEVDFLPFIDHDPNDLSTVYTTLCFVIDQCKKQKCMYPIITFDQPLWLKAMKLKESCRLDITILLGNFHTQMSFLGTIGYVMANSGLKEIFSTCYAENSCDKILSGKSYARAVRAHGLLATVLKKIILQQVPLSENSLIEKCVDEYNQLMDQTDHNILHINNKQGLMLRLEMKKIQDTLAYSPLNKLWLVYIEMVDLLQLNIAAERSGNWENYLASLKEMLPYFAATGHNNYTRCVYWFVQEMTENLNPLVVNHFQKGLFVVRRTKQFWSGVSPDLAIEQTLMASFKGNSGLTRGRSLSEINRLVWILSRPIVCKIDQNLRQLTKSDVVNKNPCHPKHVLPSTIDRDARDMKTMEEFCTARFLLNLEVTDAKGIMNIASGLKAPSNVSVHEVVEVGKRTLQNMIGQSPSTFKFKKSMQCIQIPSKAKVENPKQCINIDSSILFQRLLTACNIDEMENAFSYEMSHYPSSMFHDNGFMRQANKSQLGHTIVQLYQGDDVAPDFGDGSWETIIDGGLLLHILAWDRGEMFGTIANKYINYVGKISRSATIIFDGYLEKSTKDEIHEHRNPISSLDIIFEEKTKLDCKKEYFLSNPNNKQRFIDFLGKKLSESGHIIIHSTGDADVKIVKATEMMSRKGNTQVIANDSDISSMLIALRR